MSNVTDILVRWVEEIRKELSDQDRRITRVETTIKVVYILISLFIAAIGVIVALLAHLRSVA